VLLEMARDVEDLPNIPAPPPLGEIDPNGVYTLAVQLGQTGVVGAADASADGSPEDLTGGDTGGDFSDTASDFGAGDGGLVDFGGGTDASGSGLDGGQALGGGKSTGTGTGATLGTTRNLSNNFGGRLGFLYLALMFAVLSLCIAPRLAIPARFPGRNP
jgi:hypothetical protein